MRIFKLLATTTLICLMNLAFSTAADSYPNLCNFPLWLQAQGLTNGCVTNQQWHNGVHAFEAAKKDGTLAHYTSVAAPAQTSAEAPASQPAASTQSSDGSNDPNMCNVWGLAFCTTHDHWVAGWFAHPDNGKTAEEIPAGNVAYIIAYTGSVLPSRASQAAKQEPSYTKEQCAVTIHQGRSNTIFITSRACLIDEISHGRGKAILKRFQLGVRLTDDQAWKVNISVESTDSPVSFKYRLGFPVPDFVCDVDGQGTEGRFKFHASILKTLAGHRKKIKVTSRCERV